MTHYSRGIFHHNCTIMASERAILGSMPIFYFQSLLVVVCRLSSSPTPPNLYILVNFMCVCVLFSQCALHNAILVDGHVTSSFLMGTFFWKIIVTLPLLNHSTPHRNVVYIVMHYCNIYWLDYLILKYISSLATPTLYTITHKWCFHFMAFTHHHIFYFVFILNKNWGFILNFAYTQPCVLFHKQKNLLICSKSHPYQSCWITCLKQSTIATKTIDR